MIKRFFLLVMAACLCLSILTGCMKSEDAPAVVVPTNEPGTYAQITAAEAKRLMDSGVSCIILDVRTQEEFDGGHIAGAVLLPVNDVLSEAEQALPDKEQLILVYCRSGRRSKNAASDLAAFGYTNVKEFGGIIEWPYETVIE